MASKRATNGRKSSPSKSPGKNGAGVKRKKEILGVLMMSVALLLGLSIFSYNMADDSVLQNYSFTELLNLSQTPATQITNWLGPVGAVISNFLVYSLFGYTTIVLPGLLLKYGWLIFRQQPLAQFHKRAFYLFLVMLTISALFGWFNELTGTPSHAFAGVLGINFSGFLIALTANWGSGIILFTALIAVLLLILDGDIQVTIDRMRQAGERLRHRLADWKAARAEAAAARKAAKAEAEAEAEEEYEEDDFETEAEELSGSPSPEKKHGAAENANRNNGATGRAGSETQWPTFKDEDELAREGEHESLSGEQDEWFDSAETGETPEQRRRRIAEEERQELISRPPRAIIEKDPQHGKEGKVSAAGDQDEAEFTIIRGAEEEKASDHELRKAREEASRPRIRYRYPDHSLLDDAPPRNMQVTDEEVNQNKQIITEKLQLHGISILKIEAIIGPTVTLYELYPAPDVKISKIESYANDLKMAMATHGLRIIAPIPGKSAVGIEVPNRNRETVHIKDLIYTKKFSETKMTLPVAFGKTIENEVFMLDLTKLPHLLMAGATGSGKSVGINTIITCLLFKVHPENLKFVLIDPKKIELALYRNIQNHYLATLPDADEPIITDTSQVQLVLNSVCKEMDERYELLKMAIVRDIKAYNQKFADGALEEDLGHRHLPYIVVVIDELADLMITAGKGIEEPIARLAQLARAVGIHLVVATQRPSVNVITGTIKANFPSRIAYRVASKVDSRTILDTMGADQLVGKGDMLYTGGAGMVRVQNAFVATEEVERINAFIGAQQGFGGPFFLPRMDDDEDNGGGLPEKSERDELFEDAARVVVMHQQGSVSLLQRRLKLGYNRAGRLIDQLYAAGIVGPYQGSTARDVLIPDEVTLEQHLQDLDS
ncbi:DNA segregation ATPase FtsK/SpoIIIE, S-DNA-T family [Cyclonatronum proteinivorum]|uniref:DNA segregation ATPase FtsK/SpoIIIE, S-DNA-T family n=1 Tax=Cyclonatronum proteinivorum TaxID=1457365 RepID=A0A345UJE2_9BACT|nr:DNA translocase FtsK [Cyclonatronum proteinivorum]AXJ00594.1 DNA segregation ATPase FtsK/SpoIIIE, S-DNA-T family [Cyclonatronum proteinivorum]